MIVLRGDAKPGIGTGDLVSLTHLAMGLESLDVRTVIATQKTPEAEEILHSYPYSMWYLPVLAPQESSEAFQKACLEKNLTTVFWEITECSPSQITYHPKLTHGGIIFDEFPPKEWKFVLCWDPVWVHQMKDFKKDIVNIAGVEYVLLHPEISQFVHPGLDSFQDVDKVLITVGGSDNENHTVRILRALREQNLLLKKISIIWGPGFIYDNSLLEELELWDNKPQIFRNMRNIYRLFPDYDCVISAGGLAASELLITKTPAILFATFPHQIRRCLYFAGHSWCLYSETPEQTDFLEMFHKLKQLTLLDWGEKAGTMAVAAEIRNFLNP
ncbi:MAG: hypothetical protein H3C47_05700 [Candidatus Cloacimonetes bacterium]|nr:hypothetical protein [Candidatus Cloacimonadota bacterium]